MMGIGQLLHDLAWSFQQGKLHEMFLNDGITFATWGLVLVTLLLVLDSWRRGKEQQERRALEDDQRTNDRKELLDRWKREDERLADRQKPKFSFGLKRVKKFVMLNGLRHRKMGAELWVANFGESPLYVRELVLQHRERSSHGIEVNHIVAPGNELRFRIPDDEWQKVPGIPGCSDGNYLFGDHEVWLQLTDASHEFNSERFLYEIHYAGHSFTSLQRGAHEMRHASCPKCGFALNHLGLRASGCLTENDLQRLYWKPALDEIESSCPNHSSSYMWVVQEQTPPWLNREV